MLVDMKFASALLALSAGGTRGAALTTLPRQDNGTACGQLATRFPDKAFAPGTATYTHKSTGEYWSSHVRSSSLYLLHMHVAHPGHAQFL